MKKKMRIAAFAVSFAAAAGTVCWYLHNHFLAKADPAPIRVACVGDSITFGHGTEPRSEHNYPYLLQQHLGNKWQVKNFGVSGSIVHNIGDLPYTSTSAFLDSLEFEPDVLVLMLGTNDSKSHNWTDPEILRQDYESMLSEYLDVNPDMQILLCTCATVYDNPFDIRESRVTILNNLVRTIAEEHGYPLVDIHALTLDQPQWFPDGVHPNNEGAAAIAQAVAEALKGK